MKSDKIVARNWTEIHKTETKKAGLAGTLAEYVSRLKPGRFAGYADWTVRGFS
jgi:hypothetical protein